MRKRFRIRRDIYTCKDESPGLMSEMRTMAGQVHEFYRRQDLDWGTGRLWEGLHVGYAWLEKWLEPPVNYTNEEEL
jgi:hypothetical protein